jgi:integrase
VVASDEELDRLFAGATVHMQLYLLLCSDLAIRSGTAARLAPHDYDALRGELRFVTKLGEKLTLPVTAAITELLSMCDMDSPVPFVRQLHEMEKRGGASRVRDNNYTHTMQMEFKRLRERVGITRKLTPHDFRRTSAVKMYELTGDVCDVQALLGHRSMGSTIWYLDHDLKPVRLQNLEMIKRKVYA